MRDSAIQWRVTPCSAMVLPNASARLRAAAHGFQRALGHADHAHAMVDAAGPEAALRDLEAAAFAQQDVRRRHAHILEQHFGMAVRRVVIAEHGERPHDFTPGVSSGTRIIDCRWCGGASGSVWPMTIAILQRGSIAPEVHHLRPLMT